jgi:hypothetical protein
MFLHYLWMACTAFLLPIHWAAGIAVYKHRRYYLGDCTWIRAIEHNYMINMNSLDIQMAVVPKFLQIVWQK